MSELARLTATPPSPRTVKPEIPEALDQLVMKCPAPSADDRYQTTAELARALEGLVDDGTVRVDEFHTGAGRGGTAVLLALAVAGCCALGGGGWHSPAGKAPASAAAKEPVPPGRRLQ